MGNEFEGLDKNQCIDRSITLIVGTRDQVLRHNRITIKQSHIAPQITLADVLEELPNRIATNDALANNLGSIHILHLKGFNFTGLPEGIHRPMNRVFTNLRECYFENCPNMTSLAAIVRMRGLEELHADGCPSMTSLASLSHIPRDSHLNKLHFSGASLGSSNDDWSDTFRAIARTNAEVFKLSIWSDYTLRSLPNSIKHLRTKQGQIHLDLCYNEHLRVLGDGITKLQNLFTLHMDGCELIQEVPPNLEALNNECLVYLTNGTVETIGEKADYFQECRRRKMRGAAKVLIQANKHKEKATEKIYRPGGAGYIKSKRRFDEMVEANDESS